MKKLIPAICMLLIAAAMLGTSTFAWFSMNTKVTATGMQVTAKVGNNLFIGAINAPDTNGLGTTGMTLNGEYRSYAIQDVEALLEPVSSISGKNDTFYYTSGLNVDNSGNAIDESYSLYNPADTTTPKLFDQNYGTTGAVAYADYVLAIKAVNTSSQNYYVNMTNALLTYAESNACPAAFRVALLVQDAGETGTAAANTVSTKSILMSSGGDYFDDKTTYKLLTDAFTPTVSKADKSWKITVNGTDLFTNKAAIGTDSKWYSADCDDAGVFAPANDITAYVTFVDEAGLSNFDGTSYNLSAGVAATSGTAAPYSYLVSDTIIYSDSATATTTAKWFLDPEMKEEITSSVVASAELTYVIVNANNAVVSTTALTGVEMLGAKATVGVVPAGKTKFFKVIVRLWLEGEDKTCTNDTFATLTEEWALDLDFQLQDTIGGATVLNTASTAAPVEIPGDNDTAKTETKTVGGVTYYVYATEDDGASPTPAITSYTVSTDAIPTVTSKFYTLTGNGFNEVHEITYKVKYTVTKDTYTLSTSPVTDTQYYAVNDVTVLGETVYVKLATAPTADTKLAANTPLYYVSSTEYVLLDDVIVK